MGPSRLLFFHFNLVSVLDSSALYFINIGNKDYKIIVKTTTITTDFGLKQVQIQESPLPVILRFLMYKLKELGRALLAL